jgi:hypothetical protein
MIKGIAAVLAAVVWPFTILVIVLYFRQPLHLLLTRAAESLKIKVLRFKLFGFESELTIEEVKGALDEMLQEIVEAMNELSPGDVALFEAIDSAEGRLSLDQLVTGFQRGDRKLIRPLEGGNWQSQKHPIVTRFGKLVQALRPQIGAEAAASRISHG